MQPPAWNEYQSLLLARGSNPTRLGAAEERDFLRACGDGQIEVVAAYLKCGMTIDVRETGSNCTPLLMATKGNHLPVMGVLLDAGADIEARDSSGNSAVLSAVLCGHFEALTSLLAAGAHFDVVGNDAVSALGHAAAKVRVDLVEALLAAGR